MSKPAFVVTVSVHIKMAGEKGVSGNSSCSMMVSDNYPDVKLAENAVKRLHEAKAGMWVKWAEKQALKRLQMPMFAEMA